MRHGFSETEVLAMTETAFVQYIDILSSKSGKQDAGDSTGVTTKRFVRAKNKGKATGKTTGNTTGNTSKGT